MGMGRGLVLGANLRYTAKWLATAEGPFLYVASTVAVDHSKKLLDGRGNTGQRKHTRQVSEVRTKNNVKSNDRAPG